MILSGATLEILRPRAARGLRMTSFALRDCPLKVSCTNETLLGLAHQPFGNFPGDGDLESFALVGLDNQHDPKNDRGEAD